MIASQAPVPSHPRVVGRFAPTPSGRMHLGNVFSALMAWLSARNAGGSMALRIEDLDPRAQGRSTAELLMEDLSWLGLDWDEGPYFQSKRGDLYSAAIGRLSSRGLTYPCFCTRSELHAATAPHASDGTYVYQGTCRNLSPDEIVRKSRLRPPATRLRVPHENDPTGTISFDDLVYGRHTEVLAHECGDFLVRRSDGVVAYQLAVVVDDALMGVTQVVRGHDLLGSVPRQIYLQRLLGFPTPSYAHVPLLINPDGRRLSKRDHDLDLGIIRESGYSSHQVVGFLASLVGLAERDEEISADELVPRFSWNALRGHGPDIVMEHRACPPFVGASRKNFGR
ncbi:tRNA glutamyl-Q(34) synthetase GluQRS [Olsenella sp. Marseille-P4559]|uniref:tRNA glutamyl-Q(34) synthetase GluQRS n=1 Tax=Olsenella sp. Marseille-P4559 TaxID=2364795 RepID=UPI00103114D8|nr:tRNA glutamyl-Q(34) synthetase GluQRS [Olsenella sp. Marseille-P4559]